MLLGELALVAASIFTGAALYINVVEQPARLHLDDRSLLVEWKPAYKRGTAMQGPLAIVGLLLGLAAWWQTDHWGWVVGGLLMVANWPVTFFVIMPTNGTLMKIDPSMAGPDCRSLIKRWASRHMIRTGLGFSAILAFLWASSH